MSDQLDINSLLLDYVLESKSVVFHYQPIISSRKKRVVGFEGLMRGIDRSDNKLIPPMFLYNAAKGKNRLLELDRLCRTECLKSFRDHIYSRDTKKILFLTDVHL